MATLVHRVWPAPILEDEKNRAILEALDKIQDSGGSVEIIREGSLLAGKVKLPAIETPTGERYYGVESIRRYAASFS